MSTNIEFKQFLFEKVGNTISQSEARELKIDKKLFQDSDLDHDKQLNVEDEVLNDIEGELYMQLQEMFEEEQALAAEEEEGKIEAPQGASGGGQA